MSIDHFVLIFSIVYAQGFLNSGMDAIKFKSSDFIFQSDYWLSKGDHTPGKRTWLKKHVLVFLTDGWHLFKTILVILIGLVVYISVVLAGFRAVNPWSLLIIPGCYFSFSLGHIFGYNWFWVKK